jgi:hypothetical protein
MSATGIEIPIISTYKDKGAKAASKSLNVLTKSAKALGLAFGAYQTLKFGKGAVKAFAADDKAAGALSKTLQNLGQSYAVINTASFIQNLQNQTGVLDNQLRPAFTQLVNSTLDAKKAQELLSVALDVSAGSGKDLASVTAALSKAALGENTAIAKLNIGLTTAEAKTMDLDKVTTYLSKKFNGQAALAADSFAGKMAILTAKAETAREEIGGALVAALDDAFGDPDKYGSSIDNISNKLQGLIGSVGRFIKVTKGIFDKDNLLKLNKNTMSYKMNFDKPFDPMAMKFDYTALQKEEKALQKEAARQLRARQAAIAKEKALIAEQKKIEADRKKLEQISSLFDLDQIQIYAALQNKITDQEKLRLSLQLALLQENASEASKLATELVKSQLQTTNLAEAIAKLPKALYPFEGWSKDIDNLIAQILLMMKLLSQMGTTSTGQGVNSPSALPNIAAPFVKDGVNFAVINPQNKMSASELAKLQSKPATIAQSEAIMAAMSYRMQAQAEAYNLSQGLNRDGTTIINVNGATQGLLDELRNGLINSSASGSFSSINPFR